jgi:outer membrane lipoprotein-sorting protein
MQQGATTKKNGTPPEIAHLLLQQRVSENEAPLKPANLLRATLTLLFIMIGCADAQPAPATSAPAEPKKLSPDSPTDDVLDALDSRGDSLKDFTADVTLTDTDMALGTDSTLTGKIWMQRLPGDDARLRVLFDKRIVNDKPKADKTEYTLDKGWLIERSYADTREIRRQVLKPGQKMNLLKLGEGPFPLPLGQDKADVHRMFEVNKIEPKPEDPPGTIHAQLIPKPGTQFEPKFKKIDFWVDPASQFPVKIQTLDPNETTTRTTELKDIKINTDLVDKDFVLDPIDEKKWTIHQQPFED